MVKFLQIVVILCGLVGLPMGISMLFHQAGREAGDDDGTFEVTRPCLQSNGEPC
jgi:hypothetical protein